MPSDLASRHCEACVPGTLPLERSEAQHLHAELNPSWELLDQSLVRSFEFKNFREPFGLATRIALLAESEGHHPDLEISWGRLTVALTTHAAKGLTESDFIMAAKIDRLRV